MNVGRTSAIDPSRPLLLERDHELHLIRSALDAAGRGTGSMIVVEGEPGIGKSALVERACALARELGIKVLTARGSQLEEIHSFGVVVSLFAPTLRHRPDLLDGAAAPAAAVLRSGLASETGSPADRQALLHALHWVTINAAEPGALLVAVDDAHWADAPSLELLVYLGRRVSSLPVVLLTALRPAPASRTALGERVRFHRDAQRLTLQPLSRPAVETLIGRRAPGRLDPSQRAAIVELTRGNPFYVVELLRSSTAVPAASAPAGAGEDGVPDAIRASIRHRLADERGVARRVAEAVAILGDEADVERASVMAGATTADTVEAVRHMTDRAILDSRSLTFVHPIVRSAVLEEIPRSVRPQLHRAAADVLSSAPAAPVAAAGHLLNALPRADAQVVAILREAARRSMTAGDPATAARFLVRAVAEPPDDAMAPSVLLELAQAEAAAGDPDAPARFDEALAHLATKHERAQARLAQGHVLIQATRWPEAMRAFDAGLAEVDSRDVELKSRLEAGYISSGYIGLTDLAEANRRLGLILAAPLHDPAHRELAAWAAFQATLQLRGTAGEARALARRAVSDARYDDLVHSSQVVEIAAGVLLATGDLDEEIDLLTRGIEAARGLNAFSKAGVYAYCRSLPSLLAGRLQDTIADGEMALAAHDLGMEVFYPGTCAALAWAHIERDDLDAASTVLQMDEARWGQRLDYLLMTRVARARLSMARGDLPEALAELDQVRDAGEAMDIRTTQVLAEWRTLCAVVLRGLDRRREAVAVAEEAVDLAVRWDEPIAQGCAAWALGIAGGGTAGLAQLRRSVMILERGPARMLLARSMLDLGAALRRSGAVGEARDQLLRAAELAHGMGALRMRERARSELAATGARPRRYVISGVGALTGSELRVASLAADGMTNRAIAQALFVTPKAIEYHLANAYRKLDIRSRSELPKALNPRIDAPTSV